MSAAETLETIQRERVVAVLRAATADELMEVAKALLDGGLRCLEFTMTTPNALGMIAAGTQRFGAELLLGAGTVTDAATADAAVTAGARFLVSPVLKAEVIGVAKRRGVPVMPGAFTPAEVLAAWEAGADLVKVFPAGRLGPGYLKDLHGPFPHIPLMPTGGVGLHDAAAYLQAGAVAVGVGGNLTRRAAGDSLADLSARAARLLQSVRDLP